MREFMRYLDNLVQQVKSQQKGLRRLSRKVKRLTAERDRYRADAANFYWCATNHEVPGYSTDYAEYEAMMEEEAVEA